MKTSWLPNRLSIQIAALLGVFALGSCTWFSDPPKSGDSAAKVAPAKEPGVTNAAGQIYYVVKSDFTPLYRTGPQQPNGPDQSLPKDTLVTLLSKNFGYSRVQLENGLNGYVATEDIMLAPPQRVTPPTTTKLNTEHNSAIVEHYSVEKAAESAATSMGNAEALPELPEPRLEPEPTPVAKPDFRY